MGGFLHSRRGSTVFCVSCSFCSDGCQKPWTWLTCNIYSLEERVCFVISYYSTQKNLKGVRCLYTEQFNVPYHKWASKSVIICTVTKFEMAGRVHDDKEGKVGAKRTVWSEETTRREKLCVRRLKPVLLVWRRKSGYLLRVRIRY